MNNQLKKSALALTKIFTDVVGELPKGAVTQFGDLLRHYRADVIERELRLVAVGRALDSEACMSQLRRRLRERP